MIKLFEEYNNIDSICKKFSIENYTINPDGSIDVDGNLYLDLDVYPSGKKLDRFPLKFRKVNGNVDCSNNNLTSLEGCPQEVGGHFDCSVNKLTSLEGSPTEVGGNFNCEHNQLISLEGSPKEIGGSLNCSYNKLTSLKGCPSKIGRSLNCSYNKLTSLKGCPSKIDGDFDCFYNPLPPLIKQNISIIKRIIRCQDDYSIWNADGTLNEYRFRDMMEEIKGVRWIGTSTLSV